jgi:hypothetical protein
MQSCDQPFIYAVDRDDAERIERILTDSEDGPELPFVVFHGEKNRKGVSVVINTREVAVSL